MEIYTQSHCIDILRKLLSTLLLYLLCYHDGYVYFTHEHTHTYMCGMIRKTDKAILLRARFVCLSLPLTVSLNPSIRTSIANIFYILIVVSDTRKLQSVNYVRMELTKGDGKAKRDSEKGMKQRQQQNVHTFHYTTHIQ